MILNLNPNLHCHVSLPYIACWDSGNRPPKNSNHMLARYLLSSLALSQCPLYAIPWSTSYTNSLLSRIHVNIAKILNITYILITTHVILRSLECKCVFNTTCVYIIHTLWSFTHSTSLQITGQLLIIMKKTNVGQSDANLSPLALSCSRIHLMHDVIYCLPCNGWALVYNYEKHFRLRPLVPIYTKLFFKQSTQKR